MLSLWIIIATIIALLPLFLIKQYIKSKNNTFLIFSLLSYIILMYCYIKIFSKNDISSAYTIIQVLQILLVIMFGIFAFKETVTYKKIIGIIAGIISIYCLA